MWRRTHYEGVVMMFRFRLGSIPVHVSLFFFLTALLLGSQYAQGSPQQGAVMGAWMFIMFVSVLLHELGHALMGRAFGLVPAITLHGMGGTTSWVDATRKSKLGHGARILISAAGPGLGLLTGGLIWLLTRNVEMPPLQHDLRNAALWVNIGWSVLNLLPILPLDGGQIMASVVGALSRDRWPRAPHILSIVFAVPLGLLALQGQQLFLVLILALFVYQNVRALDLVRRRTTETSEQSNNEAPRFEELAEGFRAIDAGNGHEAIRIAENLLARTRVLEIRLGALRLLAYGRLLEGQWGALMQLLEATRFEIGAGELARFEQAANELERPEEAAQIRAWRQSMAQPDESPFKA